MIPRLASALIAITLLGCSPSYTVIPSATDGAPCQTSGLREAQRVDPNARLAAAFVSNVADVASWESHGYGTGAITLVTSPSSYPGAPLDRVDVCYYDGAFTLGGRPVGNSRPFDVLLVTVDAAGHATFRTSGFRESMPLASPPHGP